MMHHFFHFHLSSVLREGSVSIRNGSDGGSEEFIFVILLESFFQWILDHSVSRIPKIFLDSTVLSEELDLY